MHIEQLHRYLDSPAEAEGWLRSWGLDNTRRAHGNLVRMAAAGITLDLLADLCDQLAEQLPRSSDADMALNNFERFVAAARNPLSLASLLERDRQALPVLLQILATSQHLAEVLITDSESYDLLRMTEGQPVARQMLIDELTAEVAALADDKAVLAALRRFKRRETLRIGYGDIIREQSLEIVTGQISHLADAIIEAALQSAWRKLTASRGLPLTADGSVARFVVLALGKLGGAELNYSSDVDLIFLYDGEGKTEGPRQQTNAEFFERLAREIVRLLTEPTELGQCYRVDLRLRPEGERGATVPSLEGALHYYDVLGRTWERQAYVKARAVAGDLELGRQFLEQLEPWVYRRYLHRADIAGIKALKRRIEQRTIREGADGHNVKTGRGGIRDIEFVIQFLQLLNGGDLPQLRTGNTLLAIAALENGGCLTHQERSLLEENYRLLRKIEHRLQILFDLQTHLLPDEPSEVRKLAIRLGYRDKPQATAQALFEADYRQKTAVNRKILDHLLHDAFGDDSQAEPAVDLVLDPDPSGEVIAEVLAPYGFQNIEQAYANLMALSTEKIRFLSTRRCRHFLASIAPRLLGAIAATADPDSTLVNLEKVSDSLGGKGVLWELFSFNPPTLRLYVEVCANSPFLSGLLTSNPGMIDELMDSLVLNKLPSIESLRETLAELCRAAEDIEPILHSFKNTGQLNVGVRDLLNKEDLPTTTGALSDLAQVCLEQIATSEMRRLVEKLGQPTISNGLRAGEPCELVILALGKLGGRELNYHSDLDIVFLYEGEGSTVPTRRSRRNGETTTNQHFFSELATRIIKVASHLGPYGRLYEIDPRLRPTGRSGILATSLAEFGRYFSGGSAQLWERQALCKARVVYGSARASEATMEAVWKAAFERPWEGANAQTIRQMRSRLEESSSAENIKRAAGGIVDIEFIVQTLQLKHGLEHPTVRIANTLAAMDALRQAGLLSAEEANFLSESYRTLRTIEGRLRLMNATARDDLPSSPQELEKLARQLGQPSGQTLLDQVRERLQQNRRRFEQVLGDPVDEQDQPSAAQRGQPEPAA
jgi:glutamate-ammonia-ligase adenylyltransferase